MKTKKNNIPEQEPAKEKFKGSAPFIFSIPRPYEDCIVARDKDMYVKVQRLQQRYKDLKQQLLEYAERHEKQYQQTRQVIDQSFALVNRYIERKRKDRDELFG